MQVRITQPCSSHNQLLLAHAGMAPCAPMRHERFPDFTVILPASSNVQAAFLGRISAPVHDYKGAGMPTSL